MNKRSALLFLFLSFVITYSLVAQVLPKEGSQLNYRLIGFSFPTIKQVGKYKIEIAEGNYYSPDSFNKNIVKTIECKTGKTIGEVPLFGKQYTWRVIDKGSDPAKEANQLYHFSTGMIPDADTGNTRLRIIEPAGQYKDAYVFVDGNRALYDMKGNLVWYLPYINGSYTGPRDMKISLLGTITFLLGEQAFEVNYNGTILWKGPGNGNGGTSGDSASAHYHHEFTRLANGHYMILGNDGSRKTPAATAGRAGNTDSGSTLQTGRGSVQVNTDFGTIIEYDENNNIVWSWKCSGYFMNSDIYNYESPSIKRELEVHENAFYFDENTKMIYIGFKNISRIIKVKYPEGTVVNVYGEIFRKGIPEKGNGMFCGQHSCGVTQDGDLYVFNNNDCSWPEPPSIVIMQQPATEKDTLKKIWEYVCEPDGNMTGDKTNNTAKRFHRTAGGNVVELPDKSMFASLYAPYGNVFIVNRDKKILWSAIAEKRDGSKWVPNGQYRASIITNPKDLERLIWNQELDNGHNIH